MKDSKDIKIMALGVSLLACTDLFTIFFDGENKILPIISTAFLFIGAPVGVLLIIIGLFSNNKKQSKENNERRNIDIKLMLLGISSCIFANLMMFVESSVTAFIGMILLYVSPLSIIIIIIGFLNDELPGKRKNKPSKDDIAKISESKIYYEKSDK